MIQGLLNSAQGLRQHGSISHRDLYAMVEMITLRLNRHFRLYRGDDLPWEEVAPDDRVAVAGDYTILRSGKVLEYAAHTTPRA